MALPASGYFSDPNRTVGEIQQALEDQRDFVAGSNAAIPDTIPLRGMQGTFEVGPPSATSHPVRLSEVAWLGTAVAETKTLMSSNTALFPPTDNSLFRYILLSEGLDGAGQYNDGILINETITGSGVQRQVTAEINLPASPLHGQVIHLINSERSHLRPGETAGVFEQDQMQGFQVGVRSSGTNYYGYVEGDRVGFRPGIASSAPYALVEYRNDVQGVGAGLYPYSDGASGEVRKGGETRVKSVSAIYFLRVA